MTGICFLPSFCRPSVAKMRRRGVSVCSSAAACSSRRADLRRRITSTSHKTRFSGSSWRSKLYARTVHCSYFVVARDGARGIEGGGGYGHRPQPQENISKYSVFLGCSLPSSSSPSPPPSSSAPCAQCLWAMTAYCTTEVTKRVFMTSGFNIRKYSQLHNHMTI